MRMSSLGGKKVEMPTSKKKMRGQANKQQQPINRGKFRRRLEGKICPRKNKSVKTKDKQITAKKGMSLKKKGSVRSVRSRGTFEKNEGKKNFADDGESLR